MNINLGQIRPVGRGDYEASAEYLISDFVFYEGDSFISKTGTTDAPNVNNTPKNDDGVINENWDYMAKGAVSQNTSDWFPGGTVGTWLVNSKTLDRGIYRNDMVETGLINSSPVMDGSNLQGYSGFSNDNYLTVGASENLQFGTGNWTLLGWMKVGESDYNQTMFDFGVYDEDNDVYNGAHIIAYIDPDEVFKFDMTAKDGSTASLSLDVSGMLDTWMMVAIQRDGDTVRLVNGADGSTMGSVTLSGAFDLNNVGATLRAGLDLKGGNAFATGTMSMIRLTDFCVLPTQVRNMFVEENGYFTLGETFSIAQSTGQLYINKDLPSRREIGMVNDGGVIRNLEGRVLCGKALQQTDLVSVLVNGYENDWVDYNTSWKAKISKDVNGVVTIVGLLTKGSQSTTIGYLPDEYKPLQGSLMFINQASGNKFERIDYYNNGQIYCGSDGTRDGDTSWVSINAVYKARVEV